MPTLRRRRILWMQITSFKLTVKPLRVAVIRTICFTALFPGRCCGVLDSWGSSLIFMGTVGWGWREVEGEMTADHLCTQICLHPSCDAIRGESDMGENLALPASSCCTAWSVLRCKMCPSINVHKKQHGGQGDLKTSQVRFVWICLSPKLILSGAVPDTQDNAHIHPQPLDWAAC